MSIRIARILCPTDFSDCARRALDHAVALATWYGSVLTVLHVHRLSPPAFASPPALMPAAIQPTMLSEDERDHLTGTLDDYVSAERAAGLRISTLLEEGFDVPGAIVSNADALNASLIVVGTHGRSGFKRLLLGSVTERVLRTAACPVLSVPPNAAAPTSREAESHPRILCPVDLSAEGSIALQYAASLARETKGRLTVLNVIDLPPDVPVVPAPDLSVYRTALFEDARTKLDAALAGTEDARVTPLILAGRPYQEILRVAAEQQSDLIVMGVQGRTAIDLAFIGSTTQHVVRQAACPVLTVRDTA